MRMRTVTRVVPAERTEIDVRRVKALVRDMGQPSAERLLGRALDEIEERVRRADRAAGMGDFRGAAKAVRQIGPIAGAVGLTGIARVAEMSARTAEAGDGTALAATLARIGRLTHASVRAIGEAWAARL
jgi:HPt (histidine-containing phosphotransfer) domain-containing protein